MSSGPEELEASMTLLVDGHGVVRLIWSPGLRISGEVAKEAMRAVDDLNDGAERPLLIDIGSAVTTRAARMVFAGESSVSRIALLGCSAVDRVAANFTLFVDPPPVPTRYFTDETAALTWLLDDGARR